MILKNTKLKNRIKKILEKEKEIADVIIFGSFVRGKDKPKDIDILIIFKNQVNKEIEYLIRKELEKIYPNVAVISKTEKTSLEDSFDARESILFEGFSLVTGKNLAQSYGFSSWGAFKYNFSGWNKLQKTKFYYALNGRSGGTGTMQKLGCIKLSDSVILVPLENIEQFREFLESWSLKYIYIPTILPTRLARKSVLE